jgi:hypothetical protein
MIIVIISGSKRFEKLLNLALENRQSPFCFKYRTSVCSAYVLEQSGHSEGRVVDPSNAGLGAALRHSRRVLIGFGFVQSKYVRVVTLCRSSALHLA